MYLPNSSAWCDMWSIFKWNKAGLKILFFLTDCLTKAKNTSLPYYLPIGWGRTHGFMPLPRSLAQMKQMASSWIWTQITDSISYDDNCYTQS